MVCQLIEQFAITFRTASCVSSMSLSVRLIVAIVAPLAHGLEVVVAAILGLMIKMSNRQNDFSLGELGEGAMTFSTPVLGM